MVEPSYLSRLLSPCLYHCVIKLKEHFLKYIPQALQSPNDFCKKMETGEGPKEIEIEYTLHQYIHSAY